jgi:hypothetical protein
MFIDANTARADLEMVAIADCDFDVDVIASASDAQLLEMIQDWIEAGDECEPV